jgi:hypothetical protein
MPFARLRRGDPLRTLQAILRDRLGDPPDVSLVDVETHRYVDADGNELPSVGTILSRGAGMDGYSFADPAVLDLGRRVAEKIAQVERSGLNLWEEPDDDVAPHLSAWLAFKREVGWRTLMVEHVVTGVVHHPSITTFRYAGTFDVAGVMSTPPAWWPSVPRLVVLELKKGSIPTSGPPQVAAYCLAVNLALGAEVLATGAVLRLPVDGLPRLTRKRTVKDDDRDQVVFGSIMAKAPRHEIEAPLLGDFRPVSPADVRAFLAAAVRMREEDQQMEVIR